MANGVLLSNFAAKINGSWASSSFMEDVYEITVESSLHLPDVATIVLHDPQLLWIDDSSMIPGTSISVLARSDVQSGDFTEIFDGEIVELEPDFRSETQFLTVRAFDRLHRLSRGRKVQTFQNTNDGDLVSKIASAAGLSCQTGPTPEVYPYIIQSNETDLEFLRARAAALGYVVFVDGKKLHFEAPQANGQPVTLKWNDNLSEFRPRLTTVDQVNSVTVRGWDPSQKQAVVGQVQDGQGAPQIGYGKSGGATAQSAYNIDAQGLITTGPKRTQTAATKLAQAHADRRASRFVEAQGSCLGDPTIQAGTSVQISQVGDRFSGTYLVTSAGHLYRAGEYVTEFNVTGHHPANLLSLLATEEDDDTAPIRGPVVALVTDNNDPQGQGRVKVKYPWLADDQASDWARMVVPGGGNSRGIQFLPEVNDEVLVDFEQGDLNYPYVLGGLWNGQDAPPKKNSEVLEASQVKTRIIQSRTGHFITLDDSTTGGGVTIQDKNGNKIVLNAQDNSLTIQVTGNASVKANGNLTLEALGQVQIKGMGVTIDGQVGIVEVKGTLIKLN